MEPSLKAFWLPKKGNTAEEYEDAFAHSNRLMAVADGATESSFADRWARGLVKRFVEQPPSGNTPSSLLLENWLSPLQQEWHKSIPWDTLPWYAEEKSRSGAFAAFEEKTKGSLEAGKLADFVMLSRDIMTIPPPEIPRVRVTLTVVGGEIVFSE